MEWRKQLDAIEKEYGVDRWVILALWGIETSFGSNTDGFDVIRSLATLSLSEYRPDYFRDELMAALLVLQEGHITRDGMQGSWAGAMGHPQFMPSNQRSLAVDFDGDGRKNIWTSVPDVLASIGNYMRHHGWTRGLAWGCEVLIPSGFDYARSRATFAEWKALGVTRADGKPLDGKEAGILFFRAVRTARRFWSPATSSPSRSTTIRTRLRSRCRILPTARVAKARCAPPGRRRTRSCRAASASHCSASFRSLATR